MTLSVPQDDFDKIAQWHFAVGGLDTQQEILELAGAIRLRRLKAFPTAQQLADSLKSLPVAGAMAQYGAEVIRHELVIDAERFEDQTERIFPTAEAILAGLRIQFFKQINDKPDFAAFLNDLLFDRYAQRKERPADES